MKQYFLSIIETILNGYINLDPYAASLRQPLLGKMIEIQASELPFSFFFLFTPEKLIVKKQADFSDTKIQGSLLSMARLTRRQNKTAAISEFSIKITGDLETAQAFQHFWDSLIIDWEEIIAGIIGDPLAVMFGKGSRIVERALLQARRTLTQNLSEYMQEEIRVLPPRMEILDFIDDVDKLRSDFDRLAARLQRLEAHYE